jgi:hypothetical protein
MESAFLLTEQKTLRARTYQPSIHPSHIASRGTGRSSGPHSYHPRRFRILPGHPNATQHPSESRGKSTINIVVVSSTPFSLGARRRRGRTWPKQVPRERALRGAFSCEPCPRHTVTVCTAGATLQRVCHKRPRERTSM